MTQRQIAAAFNEWMRRYTEQPEEFDAEFATVKEFLAEQSNGQAPSYGDVCAAYLVSLTTTGQAAKPPATAR